jgi:hypothetical protein
MKNAGRSRAEAGLRQSLAQRLALKIDGREAEPRRRHQVCSRKTLALPVLRCRMVDLEHSQALRGKRVAEAECVQPRAKHNGLAHAARHRRGKPILRGTAACHHELAEPAPAGPRARFTRHHRAADDRHRIGVGEDRAPIQELVLRPQKGDVPGGHAWLVLHAGLAGILQDAPQTIRIRHGLQAVGHRNPPRLRRQIAIG